MRCPLDKNQLLLREKKNAYAYHCDDCDGVFLHRKAVAFFKHNYEIDILSLLKVVASEYDTPLICPACQTPMAIKEINGIELDCCENCTAIWFDDTELEPFSLEDHAPQTEEEQALATIYWLVKLIRAILN